MWNEQEATAQIALKFWGLPISIVNRYRTKGITNLYPWQLECIVSSVLNNAKNLFYRAPTSAGKSLIAEIITIKRFLELGKKSIFVVPNIICCWEQVNSMQELLQDTEIRVNGFTNLFQPSKGFKSVDIAFCTIEQANSLINCLIEEVNISELGSVVIDELSTLDDSNIGPQLNLLLTKLNYLNKIQYTHIQLIGMSAVYNQMSQLAKLMDGHLVINDYRPVILTKRIMLNGQIYDSNYKVIKDIREPAAQMLLSSSHDTDHISYLCIEAIMKAHSTIVFCPTRQNCEDIALHIAATIYSVGHPLKTKVPDIGASLRIQFNKEQLVQVFEQLFINSEFGLDKNLKKCMDFGVAYIHAGVTQMERDIIISAYKRRILKVIVATTSLTYGFNQPVERVIITTPHFYLNKPLEHSLYSLMSGRAGRKGLSEIGESILICSNTTRDDGLNLIKQTSLQSSLIPQEPLQLKKGLLEMIAFKIAKTRKDLDVFYNCSLRWEHIPSTSVTTDQDSQNQSKTLENCLTFLEHRELIERQVIAEIADPCYEATLIGLACAVAGIPIDQINSYDKYLLRSNETYDFETELEIGFFVISSSLTNQMQNMNWRTLLEIWSLFPETKQKIWEQKGINEEFMSRVATNAISTSNTKFSKELFLHRKFYIASLLHDLVNNLKMDQIIRKYSIGKGTIISIQQQALAHARVSSLFFEKLEWKELALRLKQFQIQIQFVVNLELCDLVRISTLTGHRARILFEKGITTVEILAKQDPDLIEQILFPKLATKEEATSSEKMIISETSTLIKNIFLFGRYRELNGQEAAQFIVNESKQFIINN